MKLKNFGLVGLLVFGALALLGGCASARKAPPEHLETHFLADYKDWPNTYSKVVEDKDSPFYGFIRVLVSPEALSAYKTGSAYPEGAVLVLEFNGLDEVGTSAGKEIEMGQTIWLATMVKDSSATDTDGWKYMALDGVTLRQKPEVDPITGCYGCHVSRRANDFVFSRYRY